MEASRFSKETFEAWRAHSLTALFRRYLTDFREAQAQKWAEGVSMSPEDQQTAKILGELSRLEWPDVASFYGLPVEETESEAQ
jgi:hypothetical protein